MASATDSARPAPPEVPLRTFAERPAADQAAVALVAVGIPSRVAEAIDGFALLVPVARAFQAKSVLDAMDAEAAAEAREAAADDAPPASLLGWLVASGLVGFFLVTGPRAAAVRWFASGAAQASRIGAGEWWRAATALTLHADLGHVAGNAVASVIFVGALAQWLGLGAAAWTALLAGVLGNLAAARLYPPSHSSVGASTAIFGALGALSALALARRVHVRGAVLAFGAGLALLALLGTGPGADLGAHATGFGAGLLLGLAAGIAKLDRWRTAAAAQALAGAGALAAVILAWAAALRTH